MIIPRWQHSRGLPLVELNRKAARLIGCWKHFLTTSSLYLFENIWNYSPLIVKSCYMMLFTSSIVYIRVTIGCYIKRHLFAL